MRNTVRVLALSTACVLSAASLAWSANHVRVDTISFVPPGTTGLTIGVYVSNDVAITGFVLPLEIRGYDSTAYMVTGGFTRGLNPGGRMALSPLGPAGDTWPDASQTNRTFATTVADTSGSCSRTFSGPGLGRWNTAAAQPDFVSPDALLYTTVSTGDPNIGEDVSLAPGTDPPSTPSYRIICNIGTKLGRFIIDTTCIAPANHLSFVDVNTQLVTPTFQHGSIGINVPSGVRDIESGSAVPNNYGLDQNYPNPFNAGTNIRFTTLTDGRVTLDVFNVLGQKVRTLVNQELSSGTHEADWDGRDGHGNTLSTGVYFYRIQARDFTSTRKMVMIK